MDSSSQVDSRVKLLADSLGSLPEPVAHPAFIVLAGLPGTGKSYFSHCLAEKIPVVILESDALRKTLFSLPTYSPRESSLLFEVIHILIGRLLKQGVSVILDATNLSERHREVLYRIAGQNGAKLIIVYLEASLEVISERLRQRRAAAEGKSDADWEVYQKMLGSVEEIRHRHYVVNTTHDITPAINEIVDEVMH